MTKTARTYGEALYELAKDEGLDHEILAQMETVVGLFGENPRYVDLLSLPSVPKQERCAILDESLRDSIHPYLLNFLKILVEHGTIRQLPGCAEAYRLRYNDDQGILEVTAVTAVPLDDGLREKLHSRLEAKTGKRIRLHTKVEPAVLGGVRLETEGLRLDGTVRSRLDDIQSLLRSAVL